MSGVPHDGVMFTYTGSFNLLAPRACDVSIEDIAHHLAAEPRFNGATRKPYVVGQHSVLVAELVPPEDALAALLHDGPEAYCKDAHRPLKKLIERVYSPIEFRVWCAIATQFELALDLPESVKHADQVLLATEIRDLIHPCDLRDEALAMLPMPLPREIEVWSAFEAEQAFLARFRELQGQHRTHHWNVLG